MNLEAHDVFNINHLEMAHCWCADVDGYDYDAFKKKKSATPADNDYSICLHVLVTRASKLIFIIILSVRLRVTEKK